MRGTYTGIDLNVDVSDQTRQEEVTRSLAWRRQQSQTKRETERATYTQGVFDWNAYGKHDGERRKRTKPHQRAKNYRYAPSSASRSLFTFPTRTS